MPLKTKIKELKKIYFFTPKSSHESAVYSPRAPKQQVVRCYMTRKEIGQIPRNRYRVKIIGRLPDNTPIVHGKVKEEEVFYAIDVSKKVIRTLKHFRDDIRREAKRKGKNKNGGGGGGGTPQGSSVFYRIVDEDKLADEIIAILRKYFTDDDKSQVCKVELNLYEFCFLMHCYFNYIKILKKESQLPFCNYLKNKVFAGKNKVSTRNFNHYANNDVYKNFIELLHINKNINFHYRPELPRPIEENYLLAPFQEIGWNFQKSDCFKELRREIDNAGSIKI